MPTLSLNSFLNHGRGPTPNPDSGDPITGRSVLHHYRPQALVVYACLRVAKLYDDSVQCHRGIVVHVSAECLKKTLRAGVTAWAVGTLIGRMFSRNRPSLAT
jgi:hypothetical protein